LRPTKIKFTPLDLVLLLLVVAAVIYFAYRFQNRLNYDWNWALIPQYLVRHDQQTGTWVPNILLQGLISTIRLSFWSTMLAAILGTLMGMFRISRSLFKRMVGRTYVEVVRNLPPLVLIFIFFYFVSDQLMPALGIDDYLRSCSPATQRTVSIFFTSSDQLSSFLSAIFTLALYEGAYITEIVRAGIQSVERGQWEASYALGLSRWQQMRHVILPQAIQRILPPLAGQFISTIKDSAIVSVISIQELTYQGMQLMAATYLTFEVWTTVALMYLVLNLTCSLASRRLETYLARGIS
jgi:polar amino acid transport system permease protein